MPDSIARPTSTSWPPRYARWGWTNSVLVDEERVLICGHGRVRAAAKLGLTSVPVMVARGWSDEKKTRLSLG
jgi:ParB-like chromosome segregation protein Spo0J